MSVRPQQRRADDLSPIAHGGRSRTLGSFRLAALGRSPFGRARVRLEWEVKRRGVLFDGTGTQRGAVWQDTGLAGVSLNEIVSGLEPRGYHWRMRFLYDPVTGPFQQTSRWFTVPWNGWQETDLFVSPFIGGTVWNDVDRDGIRDAVEPSMTGVTVQLLDGVGTTIQQTVTSSLGGYSFPISDGGVFRVRFVAPSGHQLTLPDQGVDDTLDSDADTVTGETALIGPPHQALDASSWSAGVFQPCLPPDEPIDIYSVRLDANSFLILDFQDGNQANQVTGYNVYRSSNAAMARGSWPRQAFNVQDMDSGAANIQWVDSSGHVSPSGIWYYDLTAYNSICGVEGPF